MTLELRVKRNRGLGSCEAARDYLGTRAGQSHWISALSDLVCYTVEN